MQVKWTDKSGKRSATDGEVWTANIGPCFLYLTELGLYHREYAPGKYRWLIDVSIWPTGAPDSQTLLKEIMEAPATIQTGYEARRWAQDEAVRLARKLPECKRPRRTFAEIPDDVAAVISARILEEINTGYRHWEDHLKRWAGPGRNPYHPPVFSAGRLLDFLDQAHLDAPAAAWWIVNHGRRRAAVQAVLNQLVKDGVLESSLGLERQREVRAYSPKGA